MKIKVPRFVFKVKGDQRLTPMEYFIYFRMLVHSQESNTDSLKWDGGEASDESNRCVASMIKKKVIDCKTEGNNYLLSVRYYRYTESIFIDSDIVKKFDPINAYIYSSVYEWNYLGAPTIRSYNGWSILLNCTPDEAKKYLEQAVGQGVVTRKRSVYYDSEGNKRYGTYEYNVCVQDEEKEQVKGDMIKEREEELKERNTKKVRTKRLKSTKNE